MKSSGLEALASGYEARHAGAGQLATIGKQFFVQFSEELTARGAGAVEIDPPAQAAGTFESLSAADTSWQLFVLGIAGDALLALRADDAFARGLVAAGLGTPISSGPGQDLTAKTVALTKTEARIFSSMLSSVVTRAAQVLKPIVGRDGDFEVLLRPGGTTQAKTFAPTQQLVTFSTKCRIGGAQGAIEIGVPPSIAAGGATSQPVRQVAIEAPDAGYRRARERLADVKVQLEAVLGTFQTTLEEVRTFEPGRVVPLQKLEGDYPRVELHAGGNSLFAGAVVGDRGWYRFLIQKKETEDGERATDH